jgi:tRNA pseudouridine32 synthase/23S rRNA pseudouridine746 synthase/23S rRNA pseudouridine1911/1915/1917 synthase
VDVDWSELRASSVIYEDDGAVVIDKPAGISVTGERHGPDLVVLGKAAGEWLMPAHRIDKVTSGLVLFAKSAAAHGPLTQQFRDQTVDKAYLAIVGATGLPERGTIDLPLSVGRKNRMRVAAPREAIVHDEMARRWSVPDHLLRDDRLDATTAFERLWEGDHHSVLIARPRTGRRHQIRVHLAWIGFPVVGDPLFGVGAPNSTRTSLHSWRLAFDAIHGDGRRIDLRADPEADFWAPIGAHGVELSTIVATS